MKKHYKGGYGITEKLGYQILLLSFFLPSFSNLAAEFNTTKKFSMISAVCFMQDQLMIAEKSHQNNFS